MSAPQGGLRGSAVVKGDSLGARAHSQQVTEVTIPARRGSIVDRKGVGLAVSLSASDVAADPRQVKTPGRTAQLIAPVLQRAPKDVYADLSKRGTGFVYLARNLPASRARKLESLKLPWLSFTPATHRSYPQDWLAAQLLGTVGTDGDGLSGLEYSENSVLRGRDGVRRTVRDALGPADPPARHAVGPARPGHPADDRLGHAGARRAGPPGRRASAYSPRGATAMVTDPRTGEILALANWPRVNANDFGSAPAFAQQDRAAGAAYEPGSTFKPFTVAGALEAGLVTPQTTFPLAPQIKVADRTIGENEPRGYETLSTAQILSQSSNVGAITIGLRLGERRFAAWVQRFGFGQRTGSDVPTEATGIVLPVQKYSGSSMGNLPIGQGIAVTPLQMAAAYGAIANGGWLRPPRVIMSMAGQPTARDRARGA